MATSTKDLKALYTDVIPKTKLKIQGEDIMAYGKKKKSKKKPMKPGKKY